MEDYTDYVKCHLVGSNGKSLESRRFMIGDRDGDNYDPLIKDISKLFQLAVTFTMYYFG